MDTKSLEDLAADPRNPRTMSQHDFDALKNSMTAFGDLSCVVFNTRTQQLVGGHRRVDALKTLAGERRILLTLKAGEGNYAGHEFLDDVGTTATGSIYIGNKQFAYREVDWDEGKQHAANIAANRIQGDWDQQLLAEIDYELSQLENGDELLALTGQTDDEIDKLLGNVSGDGVEKAEDGHNATIVCPNCGIEIER